VFPYKRSRGIEYYNIDPCANGYIIYYGQHVINFEFLQQKINRYTTSKVINKVPRKVFHHPHNSTF